MFSDIEYSNLYPKDSKPAQLYGTPKIHVFLKSLSYQVLFLLFDLLPLQLVIITTFLLST